MTKNIQGLNWKFYSKCPCELSSGQCIKYTRSMVQIPDTTKKMTKDIQGVYI